MIDCGAPHNASGVIIDPFNDITKFGALITFRCEKSVTAVCSSNGEWSTSPASLKCGDTTCTHGRYICLLYCSVAGLLGQYIKSMTCLPKSKYYCMILIASIRLPQLHLLYR